MWFQRSRVRDPSIALSFGTAWVNSVTTLEAIILGIIQGLTEFLPVSSSGHLTLAQHLLGFKDLKNFIFFDLVCHLGTLLAIFFVYSKEIKDVLFNDRQKLVQLILGIIPLFPLVLVLKPIEDIFDQPQLLGFFFMITALLLYLGVTFVGALKRYVKGSKNQDAVIIGLFQALAIFPGISRSGSTISAGRLLGWSRSDAMSFSFLLAIPTILGGSLIETIKVCTQLGEGCSLNLSATVYVTGFLTSLIVGYGALRLLMRLVLEGQLHLFVWYCLLISLFCFYLFPLRLFDF